MSRSDSTRQIDLQKWKYQACILFQYGYTICIGTDLPARCYYNNRSRRIIFENQSIRTGDN